MESKICYDLLELIDKQNKVIEKQKEIIVRLTNENLEKENMVNVLMQQEEYLY